MAHFARLDENNVVTMVTVVSNADMQNEIGAEVEALGVAVCEGVIGPGPWVQTSYNDNFRKQYAGIGYTYDAGADVFIAPAPYPSWSLDENFDWQPPVPKPGLHFDWNEEAQTWDPIPTSSEESAP